MPSHLYSPVKLNDHGSSGRVNPDGQVSLTQASVYATTGAGLRLEGTLLDILRYIAPQLDCPTNDGRLTDIEPKKTRIGTLGLQARSSEFTGPIRTWESE